MKSTLFPFVTLLASSLAAPASAQTYHATNVPAVTNWDFESAAQGSPGGSDCSTNPNGTVFATSSSGGAYLTATNFGNISVPSGMVVTSVVVGVQSRYDTGEPAQARIRGTWTGNQSATNSPTGTLFNPNSGNQNCSWFNLDITGQEASWTAAEVNSVQVRIRRASGTSTNNTLRVKAFRVQIGLGPDCNNNGVLDSIDVQSSALDCNNNNLVDSCESMNSSNDCNSNGVFDVCELSGNDCNGNGVHDDCDVDCNNNGIPEDCESISDCDNNGVPDTCQSDCDDDGIANVCELSGNNCNNNSIPDDCELPGNDCNNNGVLDECEFPTPAATADTAQLVIGGAVLIHVAENDQNFNPAVHKIKVINEPQYGTADTINQPDGFMQFQSSNTGCGMDSFSYRIEPIFGCENLDDSNTVDVDVMIMPAMQDCNGNCFDDAQDIANGVSGDCNNNLVPDECEFFDDCDFNGVLDFCDVLAGNATDCDQDGVLDECSGFEDCNNNNLPDDCESDSGSSPDCNNNGVLDECEQGGFPDCNNNSIPDECEEDCNSNNVPDSCESFPDCNSNGVPDSCDLADGRADCNSNGVIDLCEVGNTSADCNVNGVPDECENLGPDCDANGIPDECDLLTQLDCNSNLVPDDCEIALGLLTDIDQNGIGDQCEFGGMSFCLGDLSGGPGCADCPCGNTPAATPGGCTNFYGTSATLIAFGTPSVSSDSLNLFITGGTPNNSAVLVSGANALPQMGACPGGGLSTTFFDGKRCVGGDLRRHGARLMDSSGTNLVAWGPAGNPPGGILTVHGFSAGQTRYFQSFYREDQGGPCGTGQNTTNAITVTVTP